jgi:hypothetical protein
VWYRCAQESVFEIKIKPSSYNSASQLLKLLSLIGKRFLNLRKISDKSYVDALHTLEICKQLEAVECCRRVLNLDYRKLWESFPKLCAIDATQKLYDSDSIENALQNRTIRYLTIDNSSKPISANTKTIIRCVAPTITHVQVTCAEDHNSGTITALEELINVLPASSEIISIKIDISWDEKQYNPSLLFRKTPKLEKLTGVELSAEDVKTLIECCPRLRKVSGVRGTMLPYMLVHCETLKSVKEYSLGEVNRNVPSVEKLVVDCLDDLYTKCTLWQSLPRFTNLRELYATSDGIQSHMVDQVIESCPMLEIVSVNEDSLTQHDIERLFQGCTKLKRIVKKNGDVLKGRSEIDALKYWEDTTEGQVMTYP